MRQRGETAFISYPVVFLSFYNNLEQPGKSLYILYLFAHLLDQHFQFDGGSRGCGVRGFRRQRVRLAIEFLHEKIEAASDGFVASEDRADFRDVTFQPIEFLVDVEFLRDQREFGFQARGVGFDGELRQALTLPLAHRGHERRQAGADLAGDAQNIAAARFEHGVKALALAPAHRRQRLERAAEQCRRVAREGVDVEFAGPDDAGPAQDVDGVHGAVVVAEAAQFFELAAQRPHQLAIQFECVVRGVRLAKAQAAVDFAAPEPLAGLLSELRLPGPQYLGQAELQVQVAVIDGFQFPGKHAGRSVERFSRETGHAV